ncbi:hypothetical protein LWI28_008361 [Acer negundo]|uniref:Terpene synthase N-terminal domain-containing protein n=1 Tax=Acer negundo TaxID=4023 RepID=A0AAD5J3P9_ACENE|nr:hypothetical protein LWI28_008361 [Acer negundo]
MSLQVSDIASASTQSVKRHTTTYHPSIWGDHFLKYASHSLPIDATTQEEYKELKHEVRRMLISTTSDEISEKLRLIDAVQRLGVAYHFEREIGDALDKIYNGCDDDDDNNLTLSLFDFGCLDNKDIMFHVMCLNNSKMTKESSRPL